jgi:hypothetical protein
MAGATMRPIGKPDDLEAIVSMDLRIADVKEIKAASGLSPVSALTISVNDSFFVNVIELDGQIEGVWGLQLHNNNIGVPWFVCTDRLFNSRKNRTRFARRSIQVVEWMKQKSPVLMNFVWAEHSDAIEWLEWLGFTVDKEQEYFLHSTTEPFYLFSMKGDN